MKNYKSTLKFLRKNHSYPEEKINGPVKLEGWFTPNNQVLLHKYLKKYASCKNSVVLELGVWLGLSSVFIYKHTPKDCAIISVDWWEGDTSIGYVDSIDDVKLYDQYIINMWDYRDKIFPVKMDAKKAIKYLALNRIKVDLIYLDMGHSYKEVLLDLKNILSYFPGIPIVGDDYLYWNGARRAVKECLYSYGLPYLNSDGNCYAILYDTPKYHNKSKLLKVVGYKDNELIVSNIPELDILKKVEYIVVFTVNITSIPIKNENIIHLNINNKENIHRFVLFNDLYKTFKGQYSNLKNIGLIFIHEQNALEYVPDYIPNNILSISNNTNNIDLLSEIGTLIMSENMFIKIGGFPELNTTDSVLYDYVMNKIIRTNKIILHKIFMRNILTKDENIKDGNFYHSYMKNKWAIIDAVKFTI